MPVIDEDQLRFEFSDEWQVSQFDEWSFYRKPFSRLADAKATCAKCSAGLVCAACGAKRVAGTKGIDIVAIEKQAAWLIEVKDYRSTRESNYVFLADVVALKVKDTIAGLVAARINANDESEKALAVQAIACNRIRVVLHLEQPTPHSRLQSKQSRKANVLQRLKQLVKAIDPRPLVLDREDMIGATWTVTQLGRI